MLRPIVRRLVLAVMTVLLGGLLSATLVRYAPGFGADERQLDARVEQREHRRQFATQPREERKHLSLLPRLIFAAMLRGDLGDLAVAESAGSADCWRSEWW